MLAALHSCFCFFLFGFQTNGLLNHERQYVQKKYFEDNTVGRLHQKQTATE